MLLPKAVLPNPQPSVLQMVGSMHTAGTNRSPVVRCKQVWDSKCVDTSLCPAAPASGILLRLTPSCCLCSEPAWHKPWGANHIDVGKNKQVLWPQECHPGFGVPSVPRRSQLWPLEVPGIVMRHLQKAKRILPLHRRLESQESEKWLDRQL